MVKSKDTHGMSNRLLHAKRYVDRACCFYHLACITGSDVVFAVDASGSIGQENFERLIYFVIETGNQLDIDNPDTGTRVGMVTFGDDVRHEFFLDTYRYVLSSCFINTALFSYM